MLFFIIYVHKLINLICWRHVKFYVIIDFINNFTDIQVNKLSSNQFCNKENKIIKIHRFYPGDFTIFTINIIKIIYEWFTKV